jgi:uncharacterized coiled-coil protein SlyX
MDFMTLVQLIVELPELKTRIEQMEERMATEADTLARIDTFTNQLGDDVLAVNAKFDALKNAVTSGSQAAIEAAFDDLSPHLDKLQTIGDQLHQLASDPANPLPAEAPPAG